MATNKKAAAKPTKKAKSAASAKNASPAKKAVVSKKAIAGKKAPLKKVAAKPVIKKAAEVKKAAKPVKKVSKPVIKAKKVAAAKPAKKSAPIKKATASAKKAVKPIARTNNQKTVNKKNVKPVAKKAAPVKKTASSKKATPAAKKTTAAKPAAKKAVVKAPAKPVAKAPAKPVAKPEVKAAAKATIAKKVAPASQPVAKSVPAAKKAVGKKKTLTLSQMPAKAGQPVPRPTPAPSVRPSEKKPNVIIAHRRLENKSKVKNENGHSSNYQQDVYRSILDEPQMQQGPVYRYSDEELNEFKEIITSRLDAARKELNYLQGLITRKDEAGTEDTENRYMNMEDGSGAMEREQLAQLASRQIQFMGHLEKALVRIENKTYGICRITGKLIDKARLRAVPHATLSIEAKNMMAPKQGH